MIGTLVATGVGGAFQIASLIKERENEKLRKRLLKEQEEARRMSIGADIYEKTLNKNVPDDYKLNPDSDFYRNGGVISTAINNFNDNRINRQINRGVNREIRKETRNLRNENREPLFNGDLNLDPSLIPAVGGAVTSGINFLSNLDTPSDIVTMRDNVSNMKEDIRNKVKQAKLNNSFPTGGLVKNSSDTAIVDAGSHESGNDIDIGGVGQNAFVEGDEILRQRPEGVQVFSDTLIVPNTNKTFAEFAEDLSTRKGQLEASSSTPNVINNNTNKRLLDIVNQKLDRLFNTQEQLKIDAGVEVGQEKALGDFVKNNPQQATNIIGTGLSLTDNIVNAYLTSKRDVNANSYDQYKITPELIQAQELETKYDIEPELQRIDRSVDRFEEAISSEVSSSGQRLSNYRSALGMAIDKESELFSTKRKVETQLENQNKLNKQQVDAINVQSKNQAKQINANIAMKDAERRDRFQDVTRAQISANVANFSEDIIKGIERSGKIASDKQAFEAVMSQYADTGTIHNAVARGDFKSFSPDRVISIMNKAMDSGNLTMKHANEAIEAHNKIVGDKQKVPLYTTKTWTGLTSKVIDINEPAENIDYNPIIDPIIQNSKFNSNVDNNKITNSDDNIINKVTPKNAKLDTKGLINNQLAINKSRQNIQAVQNKVDLAIPGTANNIIKDLNANWKSYGITKADRDKFIKQLKALNKN